MSGVRHGSDSQGGKAAKPATPLEQLGARIVFKACLLISDELGAIRM